MEGDTYYKMSFITVLKEKTNTMNTQEGFSYKVGCSAIYLSEPDITSCQTCIYIRAACDHDIELDI